MNRRGVTRPYTEAGVSISNVNLGRYGRCLGKVQDEQMGGDNKTKDLLCPIRPTELSSFPMTEIRQESFNQSKESVTLLEGC
jgi:hypothetical protein